MGYDPYFESIKILSENDNIRVEESEGIRYILEDSNSPVTRKYYEQLFNAVVEKGHINFGDIPKSLGHIDKYSGYNKMVETLDTLSKLAVEYQNKDLVDHVSTIQTTIDNLKKLSSSYELGFKNNSSFVTTEYNSYVYFCIEATTALLYSYVDYMKTDTDDIKIVLKNTKLRADEFYFNQLSKFNTTQSRLGKEYKGMIEKMALEKGNNFIGTATLVGIGAVMLATIAVVPITREVVYQIYNNRNKLSEYLDMQAQFLEMNKTTLEMNGNISASKRIQIIKKQTELVKKLNKLSDFIRVKSSKSIFDSQNEIRKENKTMSINSIRNDVSDEPLQLL